MNKINRFKLHKCKKTVVDTTLKILSKVLEPLAILEDKFYEWKRKNKQKKVNRMTLDEVAEIMADTMIQKVIEDKWYRDTGFEFYICERNLTYGKYIFTPLEHAEDFYSHCYKGRGSIVKSWRLDNLHRRGFDSPHTNRLLAQKIENILSKTGAFDIRWYTKEEVFELKPYMKHDVVNLEDMLSIKLKQNRMY